MKKISYWARRHKTAARLLIILFIALLNVIGISTGLLFRSIGFSIPASVFLFFAALYAVGFIGYPARAQKKARFTTAAFYVRQKSCDTLLIGSTFFMIVCLANHPGHVFRYEQALNAASSLPAPVIPKDSSFGTYKSIPVFAASLRDVNGKLLKVKERKKLLKEQIKAIRHSSEPSKGGKIALIILSVIAAGLLILGVASLACTLSCGGSDVAAVIVGVGGTALVIWGLIVVIRAINGKKKKKKEAEPAVQ